MGPRRAQCPLIGGAQRLRLLEAENAKLLATLLAVLGALPSRLLANAKARLPRNNRTHEGEVLMEHKMDEHEVTTDALLALFRRAFLTAHVDDDGDIYITEGLDFPIWVSLDTEQRLIRFFTFMRRDDAQRPFTIADANHVNATVVLPTFYVRADHKDRLCSHYVLPYVDRLIDTHVITAARRFAGASAYGAQKLDEYAIH